MDFFQNLELKHYMILLVAVLFILKKALVNHPFVRKNNLLFSSILLFSLALLITVEFWGEKTWVVILVLAIGVVAIGKVIYDMYKK